MKQPPKGEIAADYQHGVTLFINGMLQNTDPILRYRSNGLEAYTELLRDDQVAPCFEQRRKAVVHSEWTVDPGTESAEDQAAADALRENLEAIDFDQITDRMLFSLMYGYGVAEIIWSIDGGRVIIEDIKVRDRSRFRFDIDLRLHLMTPTSTKGIPMPDRKFWTWSVGSETSDNPYGRGLGHALYWPVFFKRNATKFWMIFLDKFAQPTAVARVPTSLQHDREQLNEILAMLGAIQTDSAVTIPEHITVELLEATRSGTADYSAITDRMDRAIAKIILSQTMTTEDGSSRSQAEVHKDVRDEVVKSDADLLCARFNATVVKWWTEYNFPNANPPKVWRRTEPAEDLNLRIERDTKLLTLGFEPTEEYILETYGPGFVKRQTPAPTAPPQDGQPLPADFTEISKLAAQRVAHRADMQRIIDASTALASDYETLLGARVRQLLSHLEDTDDIETFKRSLTAMFADPPVADAVDAVRNATLFARLMGMFKGQR